MLPRCQQRDVVGSDDKHRGELEGSLKDPTEGPNQPKSGKVVVFIKGLGNTNELAGRCGVRVSPRKIIHVGKK
jgi:hypothetical protein